VKEILLVGSTEGSGAALTKLIGTTKFKILHTRSVSKAIKLLRKRQPDYVLCSGTIRQDSNGRYFIEV
jgi:hypothetical protein